jgi:hypothetical protein
MKSLKVVNGDLQFDGQNNLIMVDGDDELIQAVTEIIIVNAGEWFLNPLHGYDRFEVLGQKFDRDRAIDSLYAAVLQEPRVDRVENIELDFDRSGRHLDIKFEFAKANGEIVEGGVVV